MMERCFALFLAHIPLLLLAQGNALNCFNSVEVVLPLSERAPGLAPAEVNYLDADGFTFWYKVTVNAATSLSYYVAPSNTKDDYESVVFRYQGEDLCQKLLKNPPRIKVTRVVQDGFSIKSTELLKDSTYYISVLSLNPEDCGHRLVVWSGSDTLQIKATHRDCPEDGAELLVAAKAEVPDTIPETIAEIDEIANNDAVPTAAIAAGVGGIAFVAADKDSAAANGLAVGDKAIMENIYFYPNTYAFKEAARKDLESLHEFMLAYPEISIEVQGHTATNAKIKYVDPRYNGMGEQWTFTGTANELSKKRAEAVSDYLSFRGVDKSRLSTKGYGGSNKLYNVNNEHKDFSKNMRVEIEITSIGENKE